MKKNILLILMFISMFFIGSNDAEALECKANQKKCTPSAVEEYLKTTYEDSELLCLYKVTLKKNDYYTYIYYNPIETKIYAGSTLGSFNGNAPISKSDNAWMLGNSYEQLTENFVCPTNSYLDNNAINEVCFDNGNGECKNNGEKLGVGTNFNKTTNSKLEKDNAIAYKKTKTSCDKANYEGYDNVCTYINYDDKSMTEINLFYKNNETLVKYKIFNSYMELYNKNNESIKKISGSTNYYNYIKYSSLNGECPSKIYSLDYDKVIPVKTYYKEWYVNYSDIPQDIKLSKIKAYGLLVDCKNDEPSSTIPSDKEETCETLINEEIREYINIIMSAIRIGVPILLIGLVTYDFATAVLAGDEKAVNNARTKAIKRIIIAVIIFFVPTLLNLIFDLVNEIWETKFQICGLDK